MISFSKAVKNIIISNSIRVIPQGLQRRHKRRRKSVEFSEKVLTPRGRIFSSAHRVAALSDRKPSWFPLKEGNEILNLVPPYFSASVIKLNIQ
ncbi:hypothetical protein RRG08_066727 [Elysia crispata]|uniref:Uncharacterized protein n=1 Tax=Elysia crispata TaxID=231223 RepID=A0AAE1BAB4_9GAST|nr:hypothetical protein RRG08_066727 [Elysia crispata]